jgi:hypothetical protein
MTQIFQQVMVRVKFGPKGEEKQEAERKNSQQMT